MQNYLECELKHTRCKRKLKPLESWMQRYKYQFLFWPLADSTWEYDPPRSFSSTPERILWHIKMAFCAERFYKSIFILMGEYHWCWKWDENNSPKIFCNSFQPDPLRDPPQQATCVESWWSYWMLIVVYPWILSNGQLWVVLPPSQMALICGCQTDFQNFQLIVIWWIRL